MGQKCITVNSHYSNVYSSTGLVTHHERRSIITVSSYNVLSIQIIQELKNKILVLDNEFIIY